MPALDELTRHFGIEPGYHDISGTWHVTPDPTKRALLAAMGVEAASDQRAETTLRAVEAEAAQRLLPPSVALTAGPDAHVPLRHAGARLAWRLVREDGSEAAGTADTVLRDGRPMLPIDTGAPGYHRLTVGTSDALLIAAPPRAVPPKGRTWGVLAQAYSLRSERSAPIGDLEDVARLAELAARRGADFIGLSPLHAPFAADPRLYSPYTPSSRRYLNPWLIAVDEAAQWLGLPAPALDPGGALIDYPEVVRSKLAALGELWAGLKAQGQGQASGAFRSWRSAQGEALERQVLFDALYEQRSAQDPERCAWLTWPAELQTPDSPAVAAFAREHQDRVGFFAFLQWLADGQLARAQARARGAGMGIGLYRDMAIGVGPDGAVAWADPAFYAKGAVIGAPPDAFSPTGQNWSVLPLSPPALEATGFAAFIADVRANMRHAGALRIDHVMGLKRLFWIPQGGSPADGTYVRYPFSAMRHVLALESHRHGCVVIGEDLGNVPEGFREAMAEMGTLSCRVVWFERQEGGALKPPEAYPEAALASISTHDLPTVRGYWRGRDIDWRHRLGIFDDTQAETEQRSRREDRGRLHDALRNAGLLRAQIDLDDSELPEAVRLGLHRFLARTRCALVGVQLEDLLDEAEQPNLPGTVDGHPNWCRRARAATENLTTDEAAAALLRVLAEERPHG